MQDMSPEAIDHAEIMRLIREGTAFRAAPPLPLPDPGFSAAPVAERAPAAPTPPAAARQPEPADDETFRPAPPPAEIDLALIRAEARAEGRAEAEADMSDIRAAAHAAGHAEGRAEALAEAARDLDQARSALLSAAAALTDATEAATATVFAAVEAAILRLASDRAGMAIDKTPAPFAKRIETLAARIAGAGAAAEIRLNPDDLAALGDQAQPARFTADPSLARGDVVVRAGDVVIEDILKGSRP